MWHRRVRIVAKREDLPQQNAVRPTAKKTQKHKSIDRSIHEMIVASSRMLSPKYHASTEMLNNIK